MVLGQPVRADVAAGLLVDDEHELQRAPRPGASPRGPASTAATASAATWDFMSSAPRPQRKPSADVARPGVVAPLRGVGQHRVDVAEAARASGRRRCAVAGVGDQVGALGLGGQELGLEARLARGSAARCSIAARSLPGGLTVLKRMSSCSSSIALGLEFVGRIVSGQTIGVACAPCPAPPTTSLSRWSWPTSPTRSRWPGSAPRISSSRPSPT